MASAEETRYGNGYERGRTLCLTKGRDAARQWLKENPLEPHAYREGVLRALWDYEDANGYVHHDPTSTIA